MPTTLSKGYKLPLTGERDWYTSLEDNITLVNAHDHDGSNGAPISPKNLNKSTGNIAAGSWTAVAGQTGTYKQTVTVPTGYSVDNMQVKFTITGTGNEVNPTIRKVTATTYDVFTNDNTVGYTATYG